MRTALAIMDFLMGGLGLIATFTSPAPILSLTISALLLASGGVIWESRA